MKPVGKTGRGVDYWTKRISDQEMPALCSTVKALEKLAKDDVSSMSILGRSVMHDNALTSRILRVANSAIYNKGVSQVTTVSRAAVMLGFDSIRNICITAKLLSSLLEQHNLSPSVYRRLLKLMAQAFHAAMLAKMMLSDHDEELQEEVFIAALLYHLGESAFWSMGGELPDRLDDQLLRSHDGAESAAVIRELLGTSFNQLTLGIARNWGLGEVLIKSLTTPDLRTPEIRSIFMANKLSESMSDPMAAPEVVEGLLQEAADMLGQEADELRQRVLHCTQASHKLADAYGAKALVAFLPDPQRLLPAEEAATTREVPGFRCADVHVQLSKLKQLTGYAVSKTDFNLIITTTLEGILAGIGVDRCGVWFISPCKRLLQPRIVLGDEVDRIKLEFNIELQAGTNLFSQTIESKQALWVSEPGSDRWTGLLGGDLCRLTSPQGFMLAPLLVDNKVIGIYYADRMTSERNLDEEDFDSFNHFTQLANLCFGVAARQ